MGYFFSLEMLIHGTPLLRDVGGEAQGKVGKANGQEGRREKVRGVGE